VNVACLTSYAPRLPFVRPALETLCAQCSIDRTLFLVSCVDLKDAQEKTEGLKVEVRVVPDIGPGKKHLGSMFCETEDVIVTFDDDFCYSSDHAAGLLRAVRMTETVCGYCGYDLEDRTLFEGPAIYLNGALSWAYVAGWLNPDVVLEWGRMPTCWHSDDIYMGRIFHDVGRKVTVVPGEDRHIYPKPNISAWFVKESLRLHPDRLKRSEVCHQAAWGGLASSEAG
jgi:hypothetical protein